MADNHYLTSLAYMANHVKAADVIRALPTFGDDGWQMLDGLRFKPLNETDFVADLRRRLNDQMEGAPFRRFLEGVDINLIDVTGNVRPHHHEGSDVVMRCIYPGARSLALSNVGGFPLWHQVHMDYLLTIPRGVVHGFQRSGSERFLFVDFNYPPLGDEDVVYRDVA